MASAVASSMPAAAPAAVSYGWLGPRLSFSRDAPAAVAPDRGQALSLESSGCKADQPTAAAASKEFIDFEFSFGGSATMLPADELFADGKLLPLRPQPASAAAPEAERERECAPAEIPAAPEMVKTHRPSVAEVFDPYVFSPKAPTCSSRWRELLRLRKVQTPQKPSASPSPPQSPSPVPATPSRASNSSAARSLKLLLLQRNGGRASSAVASDLSVAPLLRDSSDSEASLSLASSRFSMSSSSSSSAYDHDDFPRHSLDSVDLTPKPRIRLVRSQPQRHCHPPASAPPQRHCPPPASAPPHAAHSPARRRPATPPPPSVASVDSPRMNSSGKIVFQGLERSSSSPAGSVHSSLRSRSRVMDRSYSTPVVLNVPVCSRPSFGFFKDKKETAAKDAAARLRSSLGRKTAHPAGATGGSSVSGRGLGTGK
ncbi:hypothetical protein CFC21_082798 [Triticum aestivum]|uniref:Uncharacterized protein n=3 Tax=Triticum TaxID=4564 RepID=A0A9R0XWB0_TRITD|nr:protein VASP homolog [Triticum aestivum]KAF7078344.1 hypothetical protein CFC21_082798 [Triticum aestivum]VAI44233.1 unnamed protein product [Triticum turgidum subsp. durum]